MTIRHRLKIPLHLKPEDFSPEANIARLHLLQSMAALTGGNGFRYPSGRRDRPRAKTRAERLGEMLTEDSAS